MISFVEVTLRLAEAAGIPVAKEHYGYDALAWTDYVRSHSDYTIVRSELQGWEGSSPRLLRKFRPWLSLDDAVELATSLRKAGAIQNIASGAYDPNPYAAVWVDRVGDDAEKFYAEGPTEALARFKALSLAVLGLEVEG